MKTLFHRVGKCWGVTLWGSPHVELWFCFEAIKEHQHPGQRVEVMVLWGRGIFWRVNPEASVERIQIEPRSWWRWLTIPTGWPHGFRLDSRAMVFVNVTDDGRSAAENFV